MSEANNNNALTRFLDNNSTVIVGKVYCFADATA
jgi:hypothetical protein